MVLSGKVVHDGKRIGWTKPSFDGLLENFDQFYKHYILEHVDIDYHWETIS